MFSYQVRCKVIGGTLVTVFLLSPITMYAQSTTTYQPRTQQEIIAYLYGMVTQLQLLLQLSENCCNTTDSVSQRDITVTTGSAGRITDDSAELSGKIQSDHKQSVRVWFEYDTSRDLDDRSKTTRVSLTANVTKEVKIRITGLNDDDTYYYRFVVEDEDGESIEGKTRTFMTDGEGNNNDEDDEDSGDHRLTVKGSDFSIGDEIEVSFEVEDDRVSGSNWIGLFRTNSNDYTYDDWNYIGNDDTGSLTFTVFTEGEYEFRLFLDGGYTRVAVSDEFTVR